MSEFIRTFVENLRRQVKVDVKWAIRINNFNKFNLY